MLTLANGNGTKILCLTAKRTREKKVAPNSFPYCLKERDLLIHLCYMSSVLSSKLPGAIN